MRKESLRHASLPCEPLNGNLYDEECYQVAGTGAIVTLSSSVGLIYFYCSRLPSDRLVTSNYVFSDATFFFPTFDFCSEKCTSLMLFYVLGALNIQLLQACSEVCHR